MGISIRFEIHIHVNRNEGKTNDKLECSNVKRSFLKSAAEEVERLRTSLSVSTIENYKTALRSLGRYLKGDIDVSCINQELVKSFEKWLREQRLCLNSVSCYMRSLRSMINRVNGEGNTNAFKNVYTGRVKTDKRAISESDIISIKHASLNEGSFLSLARDVFLFSYYALGMPFIDIAFLRRCQISDNVLMYYRHKTGQRVVVPLESCMLEIINRYQSENEYVFPLLHSLDPQKAYREYLKKLNRYNRSLKTLAKKAGLNIRLTSYVARHTWASIAHASNMDMPVISKALGHTNPQTTLTYIKEINDDRLARANRELLKRVSC